MKNSQSFIPAYFRLAEDIKQQVLSGKLQPGDMLLTEAQLCNLYGISKMTARQGLKLLVEEGLIESFRGKGSFVTQPKFNELVIEFPDTQCSILENASVQLLGVDVIPPDSTVSSILELQSGSKVIQSRKVYIIDDEPIALDILYTAYYRGQPAVEKEINYATFPKFISEYTGLVPMGNRVKISAVPLEKETANILRTIKNKPALRIEQLVYGIKNKPLGWSVITCNSEKYHLNAYTKTLINGSICN